MTKEILKQTLEAGLESDNPYIRQLAANAVRKARVQPVQEPTPWRDMVVVSLVREGINKHKARELADHFAAQPVQEPVGEVVEVNNDGFRCEFNRRLAVGTKLYIAQPLPVQPERKPLTDEHIDQIAHNVEPEDWNSLYYRDSWHNGFHAGFREAETEHRSQP